MFSKFLKLTKSSFCTSLKEKKVKNMINKNIEKVIKQNESELIKKEIDAIYEKVNFGKILIKLSMITIIPTTAYLIYTSFYYPKRSKQLTDAFNLALNGVVVNTGLFIGVFIGLNHKSAHKFSKHASNISTGVCSVIFSLILFQMLKSDKMNIKHIFPLFISTTGLFTAEYLLGKNLPAWYIKNRLFILLATLIIFNYIVYSDATGNSNLEQSIRTMNEYQMKSDEFKETPHLINKNYI